jgi:DNA-binding PadR family transcriptional regulator
MSPVFRHGRLRLYLLKLLDESPRHGYEVIRLLQDRFMGVYAPSPGTIYPRLARLEEEGLVTHDEADGRKVYRITDKGREELRNRSADLSDLEAEITASVRDIAREVTEDVRETVRNLREELTWAARDMQRRGGPPHGGSRHSAPPHSSSPRSSSPHRDRRAPGPDGPDAWSARDEADRARAEARRARAEARRARAEARHEARSRSRDDSWAAAADDPADRLAAEQSRLDAEQDRLNAEQAQLDQERERLTAEQARLDDEQDRLGEDQGTAAERLETEQDRLGGEQDRLGEDQGTAAERLETEQDRLGGEQDRLDEEQDRLDEEQDRLNEEQDQQEPDEGGSRQRSRGRGRGSWDWQSWADWPGRRSWPHGGPPWADPGALPDLEQLARHFTRELRDAASHAQAVSEEAAGDLRSILDDALDRIKAEVFGAKGGRPPRPGDPPPPPDQDS